MCSDQTYPTADVNNVKKRFDELKHRSDDIKSRLVIPLKKSYKTSLCMACY